MKEFGNKIALKRKDLGMTQTEFADRLCVTRQTVIRWEAGTVLPDIEKISDIADILQVSCDYLLKDDAPQEDAPAVRGIGRLLKNLAGKKVRLQFFDEEGDFDLYNSVCVIKEFEGGWMKVSAETKKGPVEKLIPVSSILSSEIIEEAE